MSTIQNLPRTRLGDEIELPPSTTEYVTEQFSVSTTAVDKSLAAGNVFIEITAENASVFVKFGTNATTSANGFQLYVLSGSTRHYALPDGVTSLSFITSAGTATVTLLQA